MKTNNPHEKETRPDKQTRQPCSQERPRNRGGVKGADVTEPVSVVAATLDVIHLEMRHSGQLQHQIVEVGALSAPAKVHCINIAEHVAPTDGVCRCIAGAREGRVA